MHSRLSILTFPGLSEGNLVSFACAVSDERVLALTTIQAMLFRAEFKSNVLTWSRRN